MGQYNSMIERIDPDRGNKSYHRGIQITWKDDVRKSGVEPGEVKIGFDRNGNKFSGAVLLNSGDIVVAPGYLFLDPFILGATVQVVSNGVLGTLTPYGLAKGYMDRVKADDNVLLAMDEGRNHLEQGKDFVLENGKIQLTDYYKERIHHSQKVMINIGYRFFELYAEHIPTECYSYTNAENLPKEVLDTIPTRAEKYKEGDRVVPADPKVSQIPSEEGTWVFGGWDVPYQTVTNGDVFFTGKWILVLNPPEESASPSETISPDTGDEGLTFNWLWLLMISGLLLMGTGAAVTLRKKEG